MLPGIKSNVYIDDILIYSEEQKGGSLAHMRDKVPLYLKVEDDSRWYPKIWQEWTKPGNYLNNLLVYLWCFSAGHTFNIAAKYEIRISQNLSDIIKYEIRIKLSIRN